MPDGNQQQSGAQQGQGQGGTQDQGQQNSAQGQGQQQQGQAMTYDTWLAQQPDDVKTLIEGNITNLRSALQSERQQREEFARQLREATKGASGATKESLDQLTGQLEAANARADFYAEAVRPEVGCTNPGLAFLAAQQAELIDKRGRVNWQQMETQYPELFKTQTTTPTGHAGTGTSNPATGKASMNDFIRRSAGR